MGGKEKWKWTLPVSITRIVVCPLAPTLATLAPGRSLLGGILVARQ